MHLYITDGTVFAGFQVANNAHLTNCQPKMSLLERPQSKHVKSDKSRNIVKGFYS